MGKSILILLLLPSALCAKEPARKEPAPKEPISVYYGSWKGEARSPGGIYNVSASFSQVGDTIKGSYTAANKKNLKKTYKGMFNLVKKSAKCYTAKVKDTASPVVFEAEVCVGKGNSLRVTSFISNGNVTINGTKDKSNFNFRTAMNKVTGTLSKIKTGDAGKKKPKKAEEDEDGLPTPQMQVQGGK